MVRQHHFLSIALTVCLAAVAAGCGTDTSDQNDAQADSEATEEPTDTEQTTSTSVPPTTSVQSTVTTNEADITTVVDERYLIADPDTELWTGSSSGLESAEAGFLVVRDGCVGISGPDPSEAFG